MSYYNDFSEWQDVLEAFGGIWSFNSTEPETLKFFEDNPEPEKVFVANYDRDNYDGSAAVVWYNKGNYYFLQGSHCSCYGLEEIGFDPEVYESKELFVKFLEKSNYLYGLSIEQLKTLIEDVKNYEPKPNLPEKLGEEYCDYLGEE